MFHFEVSIAGSWKPTASHDFSLPSPKHESSHGNITCSINIFNHFTKRLTVAREWGLPRLPVSLTPHENSWFLSLSTMVHSFTFSSFWVSSVFFSKETSSHGFLTTASQGCFLNRQTKFCCILQVCRETCRVMSCTTPHLLHSRRYSALLSSAQEAPWNLMLPFKRKPCLSHVWRSKQITPAHVANWLSRQARVSVKLSEFCSTSKIASRWITIHAFQGAARWHEPSLLQLTTPRCDSPIVCIVILLYEAFNTCCSSENWCRWLFHFSPDTYQSLAGYMVYHYLVAVC